jgi:argininosuccinate synthase
MIDNLDEFRREVRSCVVLYSGGLDSSWFLHWCRENGVRAYAVYVHLEDGPQDPAVEQRARQLGATPLSFDRVDVFLGDYVAPAIRAGGLYQNAFPVCSSLSRPLMAEVAVRAAASVGTNCVVHTTTFEQNSAARFNNSIRVLAPDVIVANPLVQHPVAREEKRRQLEALGVSVREGIYSIDENIWGRVIECGELDDPANEVPPHVWRITTHPYDAPRRPTKLALRFEAGVPVAVDGERMPLTRLVSLLNEVGGRYGVGRYNSLEDTFLGIKNHEVRESPGAHSILAAHAALERGTLTQRELRVKGQADSEWVELAVNGGWHTPLREALDALITSLSRVVNGEVVLEFQPGAAFVSALRSEAALHFSNVARHGSVSLADFSYREYFDLLALPHEMRSRRRL